MDKLTIYEPGNVGTVEDMKPTKSITEILFTCQDKEQTKKVIKASVAIIAGKYLALNPKGKAVTNEDGFRLITEFILEDFKFLELQEIEYIFKKGILGRWSDEIYNEISIDTICGKRGWIETYVKTDRKNKLKKHAIEKPIYSGNEISIDEFYKKNPEYEKRMKLNELFIKAKSEMCDMGELKMFYKLNDKKDSDMKDAIEKTRQNYDAMSKAEKENITWTQYQKMWINSLIFGSVNSKKQTH